MSWKLDEQAARLPGVWVDEDSRGIPVVPGKYKAVVKYGELSDAMEVRVIPDPRFEYEEAVDVALYQAQKRLDKSTAKLAEALKQLQTSEETVEKVAAQAGKAGNREIVAASEAMAKELKRLNAIAKAPRPERQVGAWQSFEVTASSKVSDASQALMARLYVPSAQDMALVEQAEALVAAFVKQANAFYDKEWHAYRKQVEEADLSWFRE